MSDIHGMHHYVGWRTCPNCGKIKFIPTADWVYKQKRITKGGHYEGVDYYCSYTCYRIHARKFRREREV